jgi:hypothetical protein
MKKINEDLYRDDPTPEELVAIIRAEEAKIRRVGREEYTEWMSYAQGTYFTSPDVHSWRDLRREKLEQAADEILQFTEALHITESVNEDFKVENDEPSGHFLDEMYKRFMREDGPVNVTIMYMTKHHDAQGKRVYAIQYKVEDF